MLNKSSDTIAICNLIFDNEVGLRIIGLYSHQGLSLIMSCAYRLLCFNTQQQIVYYRWYITETSAATGKAQLLNSGKRDIANVVIDKIIKNTREQKLKDVIAFKLQECKRCDCLHNDGNARLCGACLRIKQGNRPNNTHRASSCKNALQKATQIWLYDIQRATCKLCKQLLKQTK